MDYYCGVNMVDSSKLKTSKLALHTERCAESDNIDSRLADQIHLLQLGMKLRPQGGKRAAEYVNAAIIPRDNNYIFQLEKERRVFISF